jgi:hypothetical protein
MNHLRLSRVILLLLVVVLFNACTKPRYESAEGRFKVAFRGVPQENTELVPTSNGDISVSMFLDEVNADEVFLVGYSDYPEAVLNQNSPEDHLQQTAENVASSVKGSLKDLKSNTYPGFPSLDFNVDGEPFDVSYRLVIKDLRMYQVGIMKQNSPIEEKEIREFIHSFEIMD